MIHPEAHDGGDQYLSSFSFGYLAADQMREVTQESGPPINFVQQIGERDERDAPLETALELLGGLRDNRVQRCQMHMTVLVDGHVLDAVNISCELGKLGLASRHQVQDWLEQYGRVG